MAEEGVVQLFLPQDGSSAIVGVRRRAAARRAEGAAPGRVRPADRLRADPLHPSAAGSNRRIRPELDKFVGSHGSSMASDLDGAPVFMATTRFSLRYEEERAPAIRFTDVKDYQSGGPDDQRRPPRKPRNGAGAAPDCHILPSSGKSTLRLEIGPTGVSRLRGRPLSTLLQLRLQERQVERLRMKASAPARCATLMSSKLNEVSVRMNGMFIKTSSARISRRQLDSVHRLHVEVGDHQAITLAAQLLQRCGPSVTPSTSGKAEAVHQLGIRRTSLTWSSTIRIGGASLIGSSQRG